VKLLLDENLSRRLVRRIEDLFPGTRHVASEGLLQAPDSEVWNYARVNGFAIVSADADFYELAITLGPPPKALIRNESIRIAEFEKDPEKAVLVLRPH
jgi:predicted nuclease of predicted toxin-antitoxin system